MELSAKQQAVDLIKKSKKILLVGHANPGGDSVGSSLALSRVLQGLDKEVSIVCSDSIPESLHFLQGLGDIKKELEGSRDFIIKLNVKDKPVEKLSYNVKDDDLNIIISSENGTYETSDVVFEKGSYKYDLVIVLDTADVDKIDKIYDDNTELFFETPVINIDHHAGNEHFGTVNFVDLTATSTAEILVSLIESMNVKFDEEVATYLLTGIISDTESFKNQNTTPKSLTVSAQLLAAGARKQEIINNLYKTKPINALRLWGKVLSRLEQDAEHRFVYSMLTHDDFKELGAGIDDVKEVMDELVSSTPGADIILLLCEDEPNKVTGKLHGRKGTDVLAIASLFGGNGEFHSAEFEIKDTTLGSAAEAVIEKIRSIREKSLGLERPDEKKKALGGIQKIDKSKEGYKEVQKTPAKEDVEEEPTSSENIQPETKVDEVKEALMQEMIGDTEGDTEKPDKAKAEEELKQITKDKVVEPTTDKSNDAITSALDSLEKERVEREDAEGKIQDEGANENMTSLKDVLKGKFNKGKKKTLGNEVFKDENEDILTSNGEIVHEDTDEGDIRVWRPGE